MLPPRQAITVSLERVLAYLDPEQQKLQHAVSLDLDPPKIFHSEQPAILVMILGEPQLKPVIQGKTDLMFVTNTNWDILYRITSYNVCYTKLLRLSTEWVSSRTVHSFNDGGENMKKAIAVIFGCFILGGVSVVQAAPPAQPKWMDSPVKEWVAKARKETKQVSVADLKAAMDKDEDIVILDVREPDEYTVAHVITSYSIHYTKLYDTSLASLIRPLSTAGRRR